MSRYEELVEVAKEEQKKWFDRNDNAQKFIALFLNKFTAYCAMPQGCLKILPWNEQKQVFQGKTDQVYVLPTAVRYNEGEDEWGIGVCIILSSPKEFPRRTVSAGMFVREDESRFSVRIAKSEMHEIDLNVQPQYEAFFDSIVKELKESFRGPRKDQQGKYGFRVANVPKSDNEVQA